MIFLFSPPQASLSFVLFPLLSKKWPIFAKSYYYRSMHDPIYAYLLSRGAERILQINQAF